MKSLKNFVLGAFAILALMVGTVVEQATNIEVAVIRNRNQTTYLCCGEAEAGDITDNQEMKLAIVSCVTLLTGLIQVS